MTAGHIFAGFHEVIVTEDTLQAIEKAKRQQRSLWRVSSTMFSSIRYDEMLQPLDMFKSSVSPALPSLTSPSTRQSWSPTR